MNSRLHHWYSENQYLIDLTVDKVLKYIHDNVVIYKSIPYVFYVQEQDLKDALIEFFYAKRFRNLR